MLTVGLVVEGVYDEAAVTELALKCVSSEVRVICRPCGNAIQLMKRFPAFLEEFRHSKDGSPVDKAIVIRDADRKNPSDLIARMEAKIAGRTYPFPRRLLVIVQALEAWLLADEVALSSLTGNPQQRIPDPETVNDPKQRLKRILSDGRITYTAEVARKIAAAARMEILASRCPSFKTFQDAVVNV